MEQPTDQLERTDVTCCIAGCGPAGAMLGLLLARAGIDVLVLEKHGDFLRDFRGDTLHPSTLRLFDELGLADQLLRVPHQEAQVLGVTTDAGEFTGDVLVTWPRIEIGWRGLSTDMDRNRRSLAELASVGDVEWIGTGHGPPLTHDAADTVRRLLLGAPAA